MRATKALCRERCAYRNQPPCFEVRHDLSTNGDHWVEDCENNPHCITMAIAVLLAYYPKREP
jgi:hypothetical protein